MTEIESLNRYNATHYDASDPDCEVEFFYEREAFEDWCDRSETRGGKKKTLRGREAEKVSLVRVSTDG